MFNGGSINKCKERLLAEIKIHSFLRHPNLIKLYGVFNDDFNIYLFMELGCDGHLFQYMRNHGKIAEDATSYITREMLSGVKYLHRNNIIHRDIKPENIVLSYVLVGISREHPRYVISAGLFTRTPLH